MLFLLLFLFSTIILDKGVGLAICETVATDEVGSTWVISLWFEVGFPTAELFDGEVKVT